MKIIAVTVISLIVISGFIWINLKGSTTNRQANIIDVQPIPTLLPSQTVESKIMKLTSTAFKDNIDIPLKYTCDGEGINPPLDINDVPVEAKSLALIVDDPDAPNGDFVHWLLWNIPPSTITLPENNKPQGAIEGQTSIGKPGFVSPCPPYGTHRYQFKLYALNEILNLPANSNKKQLEKALIGHVIDQAQLTGLYRK